MIIVVFYLLCNSIAAETTVDFPPIADGYMWETGPGGNGNNVELAVGWGPYYGDYYNALKFDVSNISSGATILSADLYCYYYDAWGSGFHDRSVLLYGGKGYWTEIVITAQFDLVSVDIQETKQVEVTGRPLMIPCPDKPLTSR